MKYKEQQISPNGNVAFHDVTLTKSDYLASGGEGDIYVKNNTAYKIYQDQKKMIPVGKIQELSLIQNQACIRPKNIVLDNKGPVGYTMRFVQDTHVLCQLFTMAFRNRNNISHDKMQVLIKSLYNLIDDIHKAQIVIVDLNEMNFLVQSKFEEIYAIDTDSYQTRTFPATAIMDSIRDRHAKSFSEQTDWFSYGILSFQMFTGIHPFKGKHSVYKNIEERMQNNISVLNKDVSVPKACYTFDVIPEVYKLWYKAVFDDAKRFPPPINFDQVKVQIQANIVIGSDKVDITFIKEYDSNIINIYYFGNTKVQTLNSMYLTDYKKINHDNACFAYTKTGAQFLCTVNNSKLKVINTNTEKEIHCNIDAQSIMQYSGNLYIKSNEKILVLEIIETKQSIILSANIAANVLEHSSKFFDGCLVQNIVGAYYVSIFPEHGVHHQIKMSEFDTHKIIDAKFENNVLMTIIVDTNGKYKRTIHRWDQSFSTYDTRILDDIENKGLNFVVLDNGIAICCNENDELEIFSSKKDSSSIKIIKDSGITSDMKLFKSGSILMFASENKLYSAKMK